MIGRRALLAAAMAVPAPAPAQRFYASGTKERVVRFRAADGATLAGTLLLPIRSELQYVPGVVLIAGSGPTDRDGNNAYIPDRIDLLKQIAERLANAGIASLRYDKRGSGASTPRPRGDALALQEQFFAWSNFVADVQAAHAELLRHNEIKAYATGLIGHSEGGLLAIAASAAMGAKRPHALVLASTPGHKLADILRSQIERNGPAYAVDSERIVRTVAATGHVPNDVPRELQALFPLYGGAFLQGALAFDPAAALARLDNTCLLLQGGADTQVVPMGDIQPLIDVLSARSAGGEVLVAPMVSHNLKKIAGPDDPGFAGPLAPAISDKLTAWLTTALGA